MGVMAPLLLYFVWLALGADGLFPFPDFRRSSLWCYNDVVCVDTVLGNKEVLFSNETSFLPSEQLSTGRLENVLF